MGETVDHRGSAELPEETWAVAYEERMEKFWRSCDEGDTLIPLAYARRDNDDRLARALVRFARGHVEAGTDPDAALAVLELADGALSGMVDKDLCLRLAENLLDEAYARLLQDGRFDRYFTHDCVSAAARLATRVDDPSSVRDAVQVVRAAATSSHLCLEHADPISAKRSVRRRAAELIRIEVDRAPGLRRPLV